MSTSMSGPFAIESVTRRCIALPFDTVLRTATSGFDAAYLLLLDVTTAGGVTGIGWSFAFSAAHLRALDHLVQHVVPAVAGRSALDVQSRWTDMRRALERPGAVGSGAMAMAAIDIALWDVAGKVAGQPIATLLGGNRRHVEAYYSFGLWADLSTDALAEDARSIVAGGATAMKMRVGGRPIAEESERVREVRAAAPEAALMLDANSAWTPKQAIAMCAALADQPIEWVEDATWMRDPNEQRRIREQAPMPVCGGEDVYLSDGLDVAAAFPYDIAMLDVFRIGGISGFVRLAHALALRGVPVTPHLDTATGLHLVAGLERGIWVEYLPWWATLFQSFPPIEAGTLAVPDAPGLGLQWAADLDRYAL